MRDIDLTYEGDGRRNITRDRFRDIAQGRRWGKMMLVSVVAGESVDILCRQCLRTFTVTLKEVHHPESTVQNCPFCRSARVVREGEGPETKETARKEVDEAAKRGYFGK